jgi:hypothetical protein
LVKFVFLESGDLPRLPKLYLFAICSQQSGKPERAAELARTKKIAGPYKGTAQDYAPSTMPTVQVKPSEQLDTGTTVSSPPPIEAPWLKETPGQ